MINNYIIHTDGAFACSRQVMGLSFVVIKDNEKIYSYFDGIQGGTNNRAEIMSVLEALRWLRDNNINSATIYSDSMYVIGTMTLNYKRKKNIDLWQRMDTLIEGLNIEWKHVKGHNGDKWNELCDLLAVHGSQLILK